MIISVAAVGTLLATGGPNAADGINRALTTALLILFVAIVAAGSGMVSLDTLASQPTDWSSLSTAFPIVFLTLVYHDLIPVLCMLLGHDRPAVRTALVAGSVLPLGMFLTWNTLVLGVSATSSAAGGDPLQAMIAATGGGVGMAVEAFSLLAVVTSFIGITLGMCFYCPKGVLQLLLQDHHLPHIHTLSPPLFYHTHRYYRDCQNRTPPAAGIHQIQ